MHINRLAEVNGNMMQAVPQSCNWLQQPRYAVTAKGTEPQRARLPNVYGDENFGMYWISNKVKRGANFWGLYKRKMGYSQGRIQELSKGGTGWRAR